MTTRTSTDPWIRLARITAATGLISFALLFGTIIPLAALGEPPFTASNDEARAYFANISVGFAQTARGAQQRGGDRHSLVHRRTDPLAPPSRGRPAVAVNDRTRVWGAADGLHSPGRELGSCVLSRC